MITTRIGLETGVRVPPGTPWIERRHRGIAALLAEGAGPATTTWSPRSFIRPTAWHVLDHGWEMENESHP